MSNAIEEAVFKLHERPPAAFDMESATDSELKRFGLPIGRTETEKALIARTLKRLRGRLRFVKPRLRILPPRTKVVPALSRGRTGGVEQSELSQNWAGVAMYASLQDPVRWVTTEFTVPNVAGTAPGTAGRSSHWIGIDGYSEDAAGRQLCQCGVDCDNTPGSEVSRPYLWVEWVPGPMAVVYHEDFKLSPGDLLGVTLCTSGQGATSATANFVNLTTGVVLTPVQFSAPPGVSLSGETVEWISERPFDVDSQSTFPLGNFGNVVF